MGPVAQSFPTRRVVRIDSDQGSFVAKIDDAPGPAENDETLLRVLSFLNGRQFPHAPLLLRTRTDTSVARIGDSTIAVMEFIPLAVVESEELRASGWKDLGRASAQLNGYTDYPQPFAIPVDRALRELAERAKGQPFEQPFMEALTRAAALTEAKQTSLIHGEINEANARRRADGSVVFVDWDQAGTGPTALEYGYPLITTFISTTWSSTPPQQGHFTTGTCQVVASSSRRNFSTPPSSTLCATCGGATPHSDGSASDTPSQASTR